MNKKIVILKFDDLTKINRKVITLDNFLKSENVKASWGCIGSFFVNKDKYLKKFKRFFEIKKAVSWIKNNQKTYEFWNHGYYHTMNPYEFFEQSVDYQVDCIGKTQNIIKHLTEVEPVTFGAPCNHIDKNTEIALMHFPIIKNWFFGIENSTIKNNLKRTIDIENGVGNPDWSFFKEKYKNQQFLVLQAHPYMWDISKFEEFKKIIKFLKSENYVFIFPKEIDTL